MSLDNQKCFLTDGLCICEKQLIVDIGWIKSLTTPQIESRLDAITDKYWTHLYLKELTLRKTENCQGCKGCKGGCPNQQAHMAPGGCLYESDS